VDYQKEITERRKQVLQPILLLYTDVFLKKLGEVGQKKDPEAVDKDHLLSNESGSLI